MSEQFFTDDKMIALTVLFFLAMLGVGVVLLYWRDWDVVWIIALELIQLLALLYFWSVWLRPDSPIVLFPEANLLIRPFIVLLWFLIFTYALVRLGVKYSLRKRR